MILRLSQKLGTKIKAGTLKAMPLDDNPYADWSCHLFTANRTQYILVSNTRALYSCVMYGKGITNERVFIKGVLGSLREFMEDDGQSFVLEKFVAPAGEKVRFAKALDHSVAGSMNELIRFAIACLEGVGVAPHDLGFRLNDVLLSALAISKSDKYGKPNEAFKRLADGAGRSVVRESVAMRLAGSLFLQINRRGLGQPTTNDLPGIGEFDYSSLLTEFG